MFANYSTNFGVSWQPSYTIVSGSEDKNFSGSDDAPSSPYYGRAYTVWSNFSLGAPPIVISYSTNFGVTWSAMSQINTPPGGHYSQGCDIAIGPAGQVYVVWADPISGSPYTETEYGFGSSVNGGATWTVTDPAYAANGIRGFLSNKSSIRVNSFPRIAVDRTGGARNGWIYVTGCDINFSPAGSTPDIILHRSSNGGATWMAPVRVNQDAINAHYHWIPAVCVDDSGAVCVSYYDDRNVGGNQAQFYMSRSIDGGTTWTDVQVSDHSFTPSPIPGLAGGYQGDYTGINATAGKIYPWWADNSSGFYQTWTVAITPGPPPGHDIAVGPFLSLPGLFLINQGYAIKTKVQNVGLNNETAVPIRFYINGTLTNTTNVNLTIGQADSVSNTWTPTSAGTYTLKYISALATDTAHGNDTVQTTVTVYASPPPVCEGFNSTNFPPTGWSITGTGASYWARMAPSGFNLGTGSAMYNSWSAPTGDIGNMISPTFSTATTSPQDSLMFDYAYCPYFTSNDELIIQASTNNGTSFTTLLTMTYTDLTTTTSCSNSEFVPSSASDWRVKKVVLPVGTNKVNIEGLSAFGNDIWVDSICVQPHPVGVPPIGSEIPKVYSLAQNYPNPFNPTTKIDFALPKPGLVKLVVYDLLGAEVATLVDENLQAGYHNVSFNAGNFASGVYFYKITAGDFTNVKKMLLVK
jgi:hypothetical protein